ncbi:MAG: hypothetical protein IJ882_08140 [Paludibacteraceae bacterium]|nr:hypothetical protein [Paludibacteraceae bacterium]MBR3647636.1 hypothetical protein [Paludibacteraceae bacterium]
MNIFELINKNIFTLSEDIHTLMPVLQEVEALKKEVAQLRAIFMAPEQPNGSGEAGDKE